MYKTKNEHDKGKKRVKKFKGKFGKIGSWNRVFELICTKAIVKRITKGEINLR